MAPSRFAWGWRLKAAHDHFHEDEASAKRCEKKYWIWLNALKRPHKHTLPYREACGCPMLDPDQHREGYRLAKEWFEKAQR
jgi:hypothetical protein